MVEICEVEIVKTRCYSVVGGVMYHSIALRTISKCDITAYHMHFQVHENCCDILRQRFTKESELQFGKAVSLLRFRFL
jgi:hypothetical protein